MYHGRSSDEKAVADSLFTMIVTKTTDGITSCLAGMEK